MRKFSAWIKKVLEPAKSNFEDGKIEEVMQALGDETIRYYWMKSLEEEIWTLNIKLDRMMDENADTEWRQTAMRRRAILFVLNKILEAKELIESEREDRENQNRKAERMASLTAVPLDLRQSE
ncbi:MAG TPA: hypothetical protein VNV63_00910 [Nitrospiria bacterium]|nr:hypothetical protein [Nitrospiria bacterium]